MSYKLSLSAFVTLVLSSTSALALTCANDYGGSDGCASNVTAAGDCETLGYATGDVEGCEHYLFCPFNQDYKRCVAKSTKSCAEQGFTTDDKSSWCGKIISCESDSNYTLCAQKPVTCSIGELETSCDSGYAPKKVGMADDNVSACYECAPITCEAASGGEYITQDKYFDNPTLYMPEIRSYNLYSPDSKITSSQRCYKKGSPEMILKPINTSKCQIGDWLVSVTDVSGELYNPSYHCVSSATLESSYRNSSEIAQDWMIGGIVAFHNGSQVYTVYPVGLTPFAASSIISAKCPAAYKKSVTSGDFYGNYRVLTGRESSNEFFRYDCYMMGGSEDLLQYMTDINVNLHEPLKYGVPNSTIMGNILNNPTTISKINQAIQNVNSTSRFLFEKIDTSKEVWGEHGSMDLFYSSGGASNARVYTSSGASYPSDELKQGILVMNASEL